MLENFLGLLLLGVEQNGCLFHFAIYKGMRVFRHSLERWLQAKAISPSGEVIERTKGSPQGGVISPVVSNIFMHEVFDSWMAEENPSCPFERYADDVIIHCNSYEQACELLERIKERLKTHKLEVHPEKTKIVYCKDSNRAGGYDVVQFDFLGYTFRPRKSRNRRGRNFINFAPGISRKASKKIRDEIRSWNYHRRSDKSIDDLARMCNPTLRGWINYYGKYCKSAMYGVLFGLNQTLTTWAMRKYKKLKGHRRRAAKWLAGVAKRSPGLFAHWKMLGIRPVVE